MALTVTSRGTGTHNTGATTLVPGGRTATLAVGSLGVFCLAVDNAGANGAVTCAPASWTDAKGNVWTRQISALYDNGAASAGIEMAFYTAPITVALLTTDLGTITWDGGVSPVAKAFTWYEVIPAAGSTAIYNTGGTIAGATAANAQVTTASVAVGDAVIAGYFAENVAAVTGDSDSTNGTWTAQQTATIGSTTSGVRIATQQKIQTTTPSTQSYDVTVSSQDRIAGYIMLSERVTATGTGAITVPTATLAGIGVETFTATGAVSVPSATVAGTGTHSLAQPSGTGAISVPSATVSGTGSVILTGAGAIAVAAPVVAATGTETITGTGAVVVSASTVVGSGAEAFTATGAITVPAGTVAGAGSHTVMITGTGAISVLPPAVVGSGALVLTGSGAIAVSAVTVAGLGSEVFTGTGTVSGGAPTVDGAGLHAEAITGTGTIVGQAPTIVASGQHGQDVTGTGAISVSSPTVNGSGSVTIAVVGTGAITAPGVVIVGVGVLPEPILRGSIQATNGLHGAIARVGIRGFFVSFRPQGIVATGAQINGEIVPQEP